MEHGTVIFAIIVAILVLHYFGWIALIWLAVAGVVIAIGAFFHLIMDQEGHYDEKIIKPSKKIWHKYLIFERKLFKWIDNLFK